MGWRSQEGVSIIPRNISERQVSDAHLLGNNCQLHSSPRIVQAVANEWPLTPAGGKVASFQQPCCKENSFSLPVAAPTGYTRRLLDCFS
jgi:hypothetical protein